MKLKEYRKKLRKIGTDNNITWGQDSILYVIFDGNNPDFGRFIHLLDPKEDLEKVKEYDKEKIKELLHVSMFIFGVCFDKGENDVYNNHQVVIKTRSGKVMGIKEIAYVPWNIFNKDDKNTTGTIAIELK